MQKIDLSSRFELFRGCFSPGVRMSGELAAFYSDTEGRITRARSASSVRIAFVTDICGIDENRALRPIFFHNGHGNGKIILESVIERENDEIFVRVVSFAKQIIHADHLISCPLKHPKIVFKPL